MMSLHAFSKFVKTRMQYGFRGSGQSVKGFSLKSFSGISRGFVVPLTNVAGQIQLRQLQLPIRVKRDRNLKSQQRSSSDRHPGT
jgi:hypothetical protein